MMCMAAAHTGIVPAILPVLHSRVAAGCWSAAVCRRVSRVAVCSSCAGVLYDKRASLIEDLACCTRQRNQDACCAFDQLLSPITFCDRDWHSCCRQGCSFASECFRLSANELTRQHVAFAYAVARVSRAVIVIQVFNNETRVWNAGEVVRYDIGIGSCMKLN
jgi:hypothetical protein